MKYSLTQAVAAIMPVAQYEGSGRGRLKVWTALRAARKILLPTGLAIILALAWQYGLRNSSISSMTIVPPSAVWAALQRAYPILLVQAIPTLTATVYGFALAAVFGFGLGTSIMLSRRAQQTLGPYILFFQLIPKVAVAPLFIVWFGVGESSRLLLAVFMAFFPVVVSTLTGLLSVDRTVLRLCEAATASQWQILWSVRLPYALPHIFAGLKVSMTMAMIGVIIGEFIMAQQGLGYIIILATSDADTALVFACIALLCCIGLGLYAMLAACEWLIERRLGVTMTTGEF
jgi:NitT/TauT family transport system permease protein